MPNYWFWSEDYRQPCCLIEKQTLWGHTVCRVWLPEKNVVVQVPADRLKPLSKSQHFGKNHIVYIVTAAKIADSLNQDILLAPIDSSVIPLPHQIKALSKAVSGPRVRYLLADEVGLGKTIEAGLIMRELKLRGLVKRILVVAPKGLVMQWVAEMKFHFNEDFKLILPEDLKTLYRLYEENPWHLFDQVVVPMDSIKPMEKRRGWSKEQIVQYNQERFEALITAGWDLIIVDEAHRLAGSTEQVARYKLGRGLAEATPYLLLLSATPHQGKTDAFQRLMSLLDRDAFPDEESITRERVKPYVIRTEKRQAVDAKGKPLFKPRRTELVTIPWEERYYEQKLLYEAVTEYVRQGYNKALKEKRQYIGFLMILMQRLVASSTRAIKVTLEKRLKTLQSPAESSIFTSFLNEEEWTELDPQEQLEMFLRFKLKIFEEEIQEIKKLLDIAITCETSEPDVKAQALLDWIYQLQAEENDPNLKILVFTEFVPTQQMLYEFLTERGFKVVCLNGSMSLDERRKVQESFAKEAQILISTDAGGEGLNLQFCHVVINYDIPWNPMRLEQRIGRVDRIGQTHPVRAVNFVLEDSVEHRVLEVLKEKLAVILKELGIDKTSDVLDSAQAEHFFDELYLEAILNPHEVETKVEKVLHSLSEQLREVKNALSILESEEVKPEKIKELLDHPFPYWIERMTISFLKAYGGYIEQRGNAWKIIWPDGKILETSQFTLEEPRIRGLIQRLSQFVPGQPVPIVTFPELSQKLKGFWSLWRIALHTEERNWYRIMPLFINDEHKVFILTARYIWDQLLSSNIKILGHLESEEIETKFKILWKNVEKHGESIYKDLIEAYQAHLIYEKEKMEYAFNAKLKAIERIGLKEVREYRLRKLKEEREKFLKEFERKREVIPELTPLIVIRIEPGTL